MAYVKHLGQFGEPAESDLSGLTEAIGTGMVAGEASKRTKIMGQQAGTQAQESNIKLQLLKSSLAKEERTIEDKNRKLATEVRKRVSLRLMGKSEAEQQMILNSDSIQALTKDLIKPFLPEAYDEKTSRIIPDRLEFFPKTEEEAREVSTRTKEAMNEIEAKRLPTLTQISAMRKNVMTEAYMMGTLETPPVQEQLANLDKIQAAAEKIFQDANPNIFTNDLSGVNSEAQPAGDWWNK